MVLRGRTVR